jgi:hypothetical protein
VLSSGEAGLLAACTCHNNCRIIRNKRLKKKVSAFCVHSMSILTVRMHAMLIVCWYMEAVEGRYGALIQIGEDG